MILVKLGGSVLTDKARYKALRAEDVRRLGKECGAAADRLLVVHGAGSFGHVLAKQHGLAGGAASEEAWRAASRVHADVRELSAVVLAALRDGGLAPFAAAPWTFARLRDGALSHLDLSALLLAPRASTPVTFGDVVPDATRGVGILSGDDLVREAGLALLAAGEPVEAVFAMAADGVLDAAGGLVRTLRPDDAVRARAGGPDVTGGIVKKVDCARALARAGARVRFVNGLAPGRLRAALRGEPVEATEVVA